jgi:hypothetical protein
MSCSYKPSDLHIHRVDAAVVEPLADLGLPSPDPTCRARCRPSHEDAGRQASLPSASSNPLRRALPTSHEDDLEHCGCQRPPIAPLQCPAPKRTKNGRTSVLQQWQEGWRRGALAKVSFAAFVTLARATEGVNVWVSACMAL